jgi:predicted O-methyltransferase YrrM
MTRAAGLPGYENLPKLPPLVVAAVEATRAADFPLACTPEVGRLLQILAAHQRGKIGELGTACGVGAAWIASGMRPGTSLVTVELDPERASIASRVLAGRSDVTVLNGDWRLAGPFGPFDILFSDGGPKREPDAPTLLNPLLRPGGLVVLDDYTPETAWTPEQRALWQNDRSRTVWLENPDWSAIELQVATDMAVILAVRRA